MDFDDSSFILGKVKRIASFTSYSNFLGTLDHRLGSLEIDGYALARMQTLACIYYLRTLAMRSHLSDLSSEACRKEERERAEKRVLRQQFFLIPTKSVFPYSFLALSLVQIGHVLTRSFFKIFEPLKDAVGILLTVLVSCRISLSQSQVFLYIPSYGYILFDMSFRYRGLSCPVNAVNPIAKISPKNKEKNDKVKTSEISLVYFYQKIDRKFPLFFGRQDKCHRKRRNGIGSQLMPSVCFALSKARARRLISPTFLLHMHI
ncbi:hypothetical protein E3N88_29236 [Mikania micrantha]|uniref:Uncharacterized protein n=1 Tax=Mikania micrantha TaxID=192012 RepID=A0A5N6MIN7_9ASTR|nr:hypothetical protein E3N88_29236 [Mikania micrantha]